MDICIVDGCNRSSLSVNRGHNGYCWKHYQQMWKSGKILKRTKYDPNEYIDCGDYYEIVLYRGRKEQVEVARTKINKDDYEKVKNYKWCLMNNGYVYSRKNGKFIYLHQLLIGKNNEFEIDHKFGDILDNRKENLRLSKHHQNMWNKKCNGCYFDKIKKRWMAYITVNKKYFYLGRFKNKEDAINARREAEKKYFGEFAYNYNL